MNPAAMSTEEIRQAIASFPRWHYQFNLRGEVTPIWRQDQVNRHDQRVRYFFDPLVESFGGSLAGKRVLDLGCNAGFWALKAVQANCAYVVGVDARQMHVDQANLVFEMNEISPDRYDFICGDIFGLDYAQLGTFDIVLCLGLLYHISKPVELLERIAQANSDVLLIDTGLSMAEGAYLQLGHDSNEGQANGVGGSLVFYPTALAMLLMARQVGYSIRIVKPDFSDYTGCRDYQQGQRRAFVAVKGADRLSPPFGFEDPPPGPSPEWTA
jgi:tRNA (mo5U34)-methyltransferase